MTRSVILMAAMLAASVLAVSAQTPVPAPAPVSAPDIAAGEVSFRKCLPCHSVGPDAKNKVGPELNGLDGRKSGTAADFSYTDANKNSGITWNEETFKDYVTDPRAKIPGTKMVFAGVKNETERNNLWAYLKQFNADGTVKK